MLAETCILECPSPTCPNRIVEGDKTIRESWDSRWLMATMDLPGEWKTPECPACGEDGVECDSPLLESVEEELANG